MICSECGRDLPESEFSWRKKGVRRQERCKSCFSAYNHKRYAANKETFKQSVAAYRSANPEKVFKTRLSTFQNNPTEYNAHKVTESAIAAGVLKRPGKCSICGISGSVRRIEAHHDDYMKPLDVIWACTPCHRRLDGERREREGLKAFPRSVRIAKVSDDGSIIEIFDSIKEAADSVGRAPNTLCVASLNGKKCAGFKWKRLQ